jgi:hypothetical protein
MGSQVSRDSRSGPDARIHGAPLGTSAPRGLGLRQEQRRVAAGQAARVGPRCTDRELRRALSYTEGAPARDGRAAPLRGPDRRADRAGRSHFRAARRAASHLQRLFDRWRRGRPAGVRQPRRAGRLRNARAAGRLGERGDRDRALRRKLARHQAEGGRRTRRHRVPDLLRSARRWLRARPAFSRRPVPPEGRRAARQRDGHACLSGRPADARRGRDARPSR